MYNSIGGSTLTVARRMPPKLRVQNLSFWHTKFSKCNCLGSPRPPTRSMPPLQEILDPPLNSPHLDPDKGQKELQNKVQFDLRFYFARRGSENIHSSLWMTGIMTYPMWLELKMRRQKITKKLIKILKVDTCLKCLEIDSVLCNHSSPTLIL